MRNILGKVPEPTDLTPVQQDALTTLVGVLKRGIQVTHHHPNGKTIPSVLLFDESKKQLILKSEVRSIYSFWQGSSIVSANRH